MVYSIHLTFYVFTRVKPTTTQTLRIEDRLSAHQGHTRQTLGEFKIRIIIKYVKRGGNYHAKMKLKAFMFGLFLFNTRGNY